MELFDKIKKGIILLSLCFVCLAQVVAQNVAKIGSVEYATLQAAVDDAYDNKTGDVTIELIADIEAYTVVRQKSGLNLTIDGNNKTHSINGQILIDGMGHLTSETLKITGIAFTGDGTTADFTIPYFIAMPSPSSLPSPYTASRLSDANNVTVDNCSFNSTSTETPDNGLAAVYTGSGTQCNNITVQNCTGTNLHSLVQVSGTNTLTVDGCTVTGSESFIGIQGGAGTYIVQNCNFTTTLSTGYGIRSKSSSAAEITLSDNVFSALSANVLQLGKGGGQNSSGSIYVESGEYYGSIVNAQSATATATFVLTGGTYNQPVATVQGYCADGYLAIDEDPSAGYCTVRKQFVVTFNNNGGEGDMDPAYVNPATAEFVVPACTFTNGEWTFDKWNTKADGTGTDLNVDDVMTLTSDTILYAQWRGVAKIGETYYTTLNAAAAAVPTGTPTTIEILQNLNFYDISSSNLTGKTITFTGTPTDTLSITPDNGDAEYLVTASGADLTFETITLWNPMGPDGKNRGIAHLNKMTINNCEVIGFMRGFAETFTCNNCTFTKTGKYHMWTYGSNITFNSCTFNSYGNSDCKAINVYKEGSLSQPYRVITFNDCAFNSTPAVTTLDNSAIQINSNFCCFVVNINNCTVDGYINNESSVTGYKNLVNNKSTSVATTLYIDGNQILKQGSCDPVAQIGDTYYNTLQTALDAAYEMTGDVTIELLKNTEEDVTILQKAGLNYIIEGNNDTLNGRIFVDGGRIFPNPVGEVAITNLNFTYNNGLAYTSDNKGFVCNSQNNLSYAAHVTVSNCTFDGGDPANGMAAYRDPAGAQSWDITLDHLVAKNCHSLVQATSVSGMAITNCNATDNVKNGINISGGGSDHIPGVTNIYTIANDTLACNTDGEYSIRIQEHGRATDTFKLADNMFTAPKAIISKHNTACVIAASSGLYDGDISLESSDAATFSFTGGTFSEPKATVDGYCAYGYAAVANDPDDEHCTVRKLEVARIGTTTYPYLQDALDSARTMTGDVTIELLKNIEGYSIVRQKAGLNLTIEGNNDTIFGQIIVDGDGRAAGTETLTIQNVTFYDDGSHFYTGTDAFVLVPSTKTAGTPYYTNKYNYAHNITIDNCDFKSTSSSLNVVGIKATSGAGAYNVALTNCAGDNLHSLAQLTGTTGATFANCKVPNGDSFINVSGGAGDYVITDCKFVSSLSDGYGIRDKDGSSAIFTIERDTINASKALVFGKAAGESPAPSGQMNVSSGVYDGTVSIIPTASTATFVFTGGTFSEPKATVDGYCAYGYAAVANDPDAEHCTVRKLEVARIGTTTYPYLQDALDSARTMTGDVTIELLKNIEGYSIVRQKAGLNLTIEGNNDTIYGQIIIHGDGRLDGAETLTIQNVNFKGDQSNFYSGTDAFIAAPKTTTLPSPFTGTGNGYNYCHNVTVNGCTFNSTSVNSPDYDVVALKLSSGKNIAMDNCTGDNLHSLAQFTGTTNATITNDTITNSQSFVNVSGGAGEFVIANCEYTGSQPDDGYAVRENGTSSANITLTDNNFTANKVLVLGKGGAQNPSGTINVESGEYNGLISKETVATSTAEFVFTGGIFDEDSATVASWCAPGYLVFKYSDSPERWIVERGYMFVYDKNAATAVGTMDTIIVRQSATEADRTFEVAACEFTRPDGYAFDIWNTRPDSSGNGFEPGDNIIIVSDTTLYAIWKEGYTVFYDNNGGTGHIPPQPKYIGEDITLSDGAAFSRTDSTLYRWNTEANESGDSYELGGTYSADANATMYAVWRLNLGMTMASTDVVCYGENNGTDTVKIIGGDTPFQLVLSGTALSENDTVRNIMDRTYIFENLKPGDYTVTLTDVLGKDTITGTFTIDQPDTLVASFVSVPVAPCPLMGAGTYEVAMTSEGGNGGNVYTWGGDATDVNDTATTITPDEDDRDRTYNITVTVTDMKGCTVVIDTSFTVSPVISADGTSHSNTIMTVDTINQSILYGCDTIIRDFGTPHFTFTNPAIDENILDTIYNNVSTVAPDSVFSVSAATVITWTAVDTCGHVVTAEQVINITHKPCPSAYDFHGIEYPAVRIGCDCWTTKNLASTQYSPDGEMIPDVRSYPINTRASVYGNLYTYEAAMHGADVAAAVASNTPVQGACPEGWHVPSQAEAEALMSSAEVVALMSQGTWIPDNGTNSTGFTMLPGGFYNSALDRYERMYVSAYIWIATPETAIYHACEFGAACSSLELIPGNLTDGLSIRCVITKPAE